MTKSLRRNQVTLRFLVKGIEKIDKQLIPWVSSLDKEELSYYTKKLRASEPIFVETLK